MVEEIEPRQDSTDRSPASCVALRGLRRDINSLVIHSLLPGHGVVDLVQKA
jgi:hypothetical protein